MIESLRLKMFKPFQDQTLDLKALTLLSGLNSCGKSSVLQSLLLLRQSYQQGLLPKKGLALNGELVNLGTAKDAFFQGITRRNLGFDLTWTTDGAPDVLEASWGFSVSREDDPLELDVLNLESSPVVPEVYQSSLFGNKFHYLQAERIGPRPFNEMSDYQVRRLGQLGTGGEYAAHFLSIYRRERKIADAKLSHPRLKVIEDSSEAEQQSMDLIDQVEAWMGEISPGTRLGLDSHPDMGLVGLRYAYGDSDRYRATNVGFGITYTLPIVVAVLASEPGTLIMIENPEAHLHPKGQAKMGELLALAASCGIQVVVETHSDHVLNGIRLAVHGGKLEAEDVQLHYFQREERNRELVTEVISPRIDRNGRIDQWPDGFFDEWDNSLQALLEPRSV